jgi:hypothetical protein
MSEKNRKENFSSLVYESLLNRQKTVSFVAIIENIHSQQQRLINVDEAIRNQFFDPLDEPMGQVQQ